MTCNFNVWSQQNVSRSVKARLIFKVLDSTFKILDLNNSEFNYQEYNLSFFEYLAQLYL